MHALCIRHIAFEDLSAWAPPLEAQGWRVTYLDAGVHALDDVDPRAPDLLVVQGGPLSAYDTDLYPLLAAERDFIKRRIDRDLPTIGVCLGAQLLAAALGARVYANNAPEIGFGPIRLTEAGRRSCLAPFDDEPVTLHWHGDTFDLPAGAELLASSDLTPHQAFAIGRNILGLQFHPEWGRDPLEPWLIGHTGNLRQNHIDIAAFRAEAERLRPELAAKAERVLDLYLKNAGLGRRPLV